MFFQSLDAWENVFDLRLQHPHCLYDEPLNVAVANGLETIISVNHQLWREVVDILGNETVILATRRVLVFELLEFEELARYVVNALAEPMH